MPEELFDENFRSPGFVKENVFSGGCLPSLDRILTAMATTSRLSVKHVENLGPALISQHLDAGENFLGKSKPHNAFLAVGESYHRVREFCEAIKLYIKSWEGYNSIGNLEGQALAKINIGGVWTAKVIGQKHLRHLKRAACHLFYSLIFTYPLVSFHNILTQGVLECFPTHFW